jgi:CheY-like chemotaxis protein
MVVDDVADSAASMAELLERWGHESRMALDGATALDLAREFRPEIVMLDVGMPGMNGYELAGLLRQEFGPEIMLLAMTGYGQEEDRCQAIAAGFDHHLTKPVDLRVLCDLLSAYAIDRTHRAECKA